MQLSVTMEAAHWQAVINLLAEHPFKVVAPLVLTIQQQIGQQQAMPAPPAKPNGEVHDAA